MQRRVVLLGVALLALLLLLLFGNTSVPPQRAPLVWRAPIDQRHATAPPQTMRSLSLSQTILTTRLPEVKQQTGQRIPVAASNVHDATDHVVDDVDTLVTSLPDGFNGSAELVAAVKHELEHLEYAFKYLLFLFLPFKPATTTSGAGTTLMFGQFWNTPACITKNINSLICIKTVDASCD